MVEGWCQGPAHATIGAGGTDVRPNPSLSRPDRSEISNDPRCGLRAAPGRPPPRPSPGSSDTLVSLVARSHHGEAGRLGTPRLRSVASHCAGGAESHPTPIASPPPPPPPLAPLCPPERWRSLQLYACRLLTRPWLGAVYTHMASSGQGVVLRRAGLPPRHAICRPFFVKLWSGRPSFHAVLAVVILVSVEFHGFSWRVCWPVRAGCKKDPSVLMPASLAIELPRKIARTHP